MQRISILTMGNYTSKLTGGKSNGIFDAEVFKRYYPHILIYPKSTKHHLIRKAFS